MWRRFAWFVGFMDAGRRHGSLISRRIESYITRGYALTLSWNGFFNCARGEMFARRRVTFSNFLSIVARCEMRICVLRIATAGEYGGVLPRIRRRSGLQCKPLDYGSVYAIHRAIALLRAERAVAARGDRAHTACRCCPRKSSAWLPAACGQARLPQALARYATS